MKIVLINVVYKKGSTGVITRDLAEAYRKDGNDVYVLYGRGQKVREPKVCKTAYELESSFQHAISRISGNMYGGMPLSTMRIKRMINMINPDVVHLHCLNGYFVNIPSLLRFLKRRSCKVILTNHADFMFTANCGMSLWCEKWRTECHNCPRVKEFNGRFSLNRTHHFYKKMRKAIAGASNIQVTAVSPWLTKRCQESPMFSGLPVSTVLNGVKTASKIAVKENDPYLSIRKNSKTKIVLHITSGFHLREKGGHLLYTLANKLNKENIVFVVIGNIKSESNTDNIVFLGRINDLNSIRSHYAHADATLLLSEVETFSMIVAESLCQGTPIVGFKAGGPESITIDEYSSFVEFNDIDALASKTLETIKNKPNRKVIAKEARVKYSIEQSKNAYSAFFEDKHNQKKHSLLYRLRMSFLSFVKTKKSEVILASSLFAYFLLAALSSVSPVLYESGMVGAIYRVTIFAIFVIATSFVALLLKSRPTLILSGLLIVYVLVGIGLSFLSRQQIVLDIQNTPIELVFGWMDRFDNLARTIGVFAMVFAFVSVFPELFKRKQAVRYFAFMIGSFALVSTLYVSIFQLDTIINSFIAEGENAHFYQVSSFFSNKNLYGLMIFVGLLALAYCFINSKRGTRIGITFVNAWFMIHLVISRNKTALLLILLASLALFVYWLCVTFSEHKKRNWTITGVIAFVSIVFVLFMAVPSLHPEGTFLATIHHYFYQNFILIGLRTMGTRYQDLSLAFPLLSSWQIIVGYGEEFAYSFFASYSGMTSIDNALIAMLLTGGLIKVVLYVYLYYVSIKKIIGLKRNNPAVAYLLFVMQIAIMALGLSESIYILRTDAFAVVFMVFAFLIPNAEMHSNREERIQKNEEKRVLHVTASFLKGGTEAFILGYADLLKKENIVFDVFCYGKIDEEQRKRLEVLGGKIYEGSAPSKRGYFKAHQSFYRFLSHRDEYIAIHSNCNFDNELYLRTARDFSFDRRIFHAHDTLTGIKYTFLQKVVMNIKRFSARINSTNFVACSQEAGYDILGANYFDEYGIVIRNIVDINRFVQSDLSSADELRKKYSIPDDAFVIGNITRFEDKKNQAFIIEIFKHIAVKNDKALLVLGGPDGGTEQQIKDIVKEHGLLDRVRFIGLQKDVQKWLRVFDLYLFPSLFEGFGIVVIENQLSLLKTIASNRVPSSTDLGLGLVNYLPLENKNEWIDAIMDHTKSNVDNSTLKKALKQKGFIPEDNQVEILKLYQ